MDNWAIQGEKRNLHVRRRTGWKYNILSQLKISKSNYSDLINRNNPITSKAKCTKSNQTPFCIPLLWVYQQNHLNLYCHFSLLLTQSNLRICQSSSLSLASSWWAISLCKMPSLINLFSLDLILMQILNHIRKEDSVSNEGNSHRTLCQYVSSSGYILPLSLCWFQLMKIN